MILVGVGLGTALGFAAATGRLDLSRAASAGPTAAAAAPEQAPSSEQAWQRLQAGNNRFVEEMLERQALGRTRRQELASRQKPFAVVLTCADSRLTPEFIFNQGLGDLFVVRVAGNIADPFVLGSVEYAVEHLHVPLIVLLGHEKCGAVEAALGEEKPMGNLGKLVAEIDVGKDLPAGKEAALAAAIKNNVRHQTRLLTERSDVIKEHVATSKVRIVSGVYQLATGKVDWLDDK
ncbi:MAG: carbonic anhydrase [Planctomycetota bacterium]|nr:MAG: carbonic anhydrase [Planctomycetota bacterium]